MLLNELERLQAVNRFLKFETSRQQELDAIVKMAAEACDTPVALINMLDESYVHFKHRIGIAYECAPREMAICNLVIKENQMIEIADTHQDERLINHPAIQGENTFRFYTGTPLGTHDGYSVGTLCVLDYQPRQLSNHQKQILQVLAKQVISIIEFEFSVNILKAQYLESRNVENKLRSFFESSQESHVLIGLNMEVLAFNKTFSDFIRKMYGVQVQPGIKATDYVNQLYIDDFINNFNLALTGIPLKHERLLDYGPAGAIWCQINYNPAYDDERNIIGISFNVTNIHERKQQEYQVLEQNQALRDIAYFQSHGLRKPVASILGLMNIIKLDGYGHNQESLTMMESAVTELDDTIRQIIQATHLNDQNSTPTNDFIYPNIPVPLN